VQGHWSLLCWWCQCGQSKQSTRAQDVQGLKRGTEIHAPHYARSCLGSLTMTHQEFLSVKVVVVLEQWLLYLGTDLLLLPLLRELCRSLLPPLAVSSTCWSVVSQICGV
jgi:hypothetical protein